MRAILWHTGAVLIVSFALVRGLPAQPFVVDDTGLAPAGAVQVEA